MLSTNFYSFFYNLRPLELLKKTFKIFLVSREILLNRVSYYPPLVIHFEKKFAEFIGKKYAITFSNGTTSLEAALWALKIKPGDSVIVPSCTFHADIDAIRNMGVNIIFADVEKNSFCVSLKTVSEVYTDSVVGVIVCHLFGYAAPVDQIVSFAKEKNIFIIEDCSHSHGAKLNGSPVGSFGDIAFFSLQGAKPIAAGEGGIAVTDNQEFFVRMSAYAHFGRHSEMFNSDLIEYTGLGIGHKGRAHPLGICLALVDLKFIEKENEIIEKNVQVIESIINSKHIQFFKKSHGSYPGGRFGGIPIMVNGKNINKVIKAFKFCGIFANKYPFLLHHKLKVYGGSSEVTLENTENISKKIIFIDRRYLIYLPFFIRINFTKLVKEVNFFD